MKHPLTWSLIPCERIAGGGCARRPDGRCDVTQAIRVKVMSELQGDGRRYLPPLDLEEGNVIRMKVIGSGLDRPVWCTRIDLVLHTKPVH
jgi:hypothetical protein